ncbi:hypothetical protein NHQ30_007093 [Ciborinia camelliae]|nr:hypothetical protein NHQ30_007093 [Ciborinia camelliae]
MDCPHIHIPGTCLHSLSYFRGPDSPSDPTFDHPPDLHLDQHPTLSNHSCPIPNCSATRFHPWGCAKDWKTGFSINGLTPTPTAPAQHHHSQIDQTNGDLSAEWRWRLAMEGLRVAHERGDYGCRGGSMPPNASFPGGHKGADANNWGQNTFTGAKSKQAFGGKPYYSKDRERGRLRGGAAGGGAGMTGNREASGSSDPRANPKRGDSTWSV